MFEKVELIKILLPTLGRQVALLAVLVIALLLLTKKSTLKAIGKKWKKIVAGLMIIMVAFMLFPYTVMGIVANAIVLLGLADIALFLWKRCKEFRVWVATTVNEKTQMASGAISFWRKVLNSTPRKVAMIIILICSGSVVGVVIDIVILFGMSYFLYKFGVLDMLNWDNEIVDNVATGIAVAVAVWKIICRFGIVAAVYFMFKFKNGRIFKLELDEEDETEEEDEEE